MKSQKTVLLLYSPDRLLTILNTSPEYADSFFFHTDVVFLLSVHGVSSTVFVFIAGQEQAMLIYMFLLCFRMHAMLMNAVQIGFVKSLKGNE